MKKFENVDIIDSLRRIMNSNTQHYKSDFLYDVEKIRNAAISGNAEDKLLLFMSRPSGTYCFREKDVFMKNTAQHNAWKYYGEQTNDKILAYAVQVKGIEDDKIKGNLYQLDYQAHFRHVIQAAVRADMQTVHYQNGDINIPATEGVRAEPHPEYGAFLSCEIKPNDADELQSVLRQERRGYEKLPCGDIDKHIEGLTATKPSIRKQLADEKKTSAKQPKKDKSHKKEDISL